MVEESRTADGAYRWFAADPPHARAAPSVEQIESALADALTRVAPFPIFIDQTSSDPQAGVDGDIAAASALAEGETVVRMWRNPLCVVASCRQARLVDFGPARSASEAAGWPVVVRRSGGTAVTHRPGVLNISLLARQGGAAVSAVGQGYDGLLAILRDMLGDIGIDCDRGSVPGSFCDGRYNLRWQGRKLAGTAGCVIGGSKATVRLFHASLQIGGAFEEDLRAIHRFETALGEPLAYDPGAHVTVTQIFEALPWPVAEAA